LILAKPAHRLFQVLPRIAGVMVIVGLYFGFRVLVPLPLALQPSPGSARQTTGWPATVAENYHHDEETKNRFVAQGGLMKKAVGAGTLLLFGYVQVTSLPDFRRYIRISTM
jgi:hypothetical protein